MKKARSLRKTRQPSKIDLNFDKKSLDSMNGSSIVDAQTGRVKKEKLKYNLNDLFENTPVFDIP